MAFQRRRRNHHRFRLLIPSISIISAALLLSLFVFLSFLPPSPLHNHHLHPTLSKATANVDAVKVVEFRVPDYVNASDRHLWSSGMSKFYYGCSTASNEFAKAEAITRSNRYLLIATSGGLNQQRTGITDAVVAARILNATLVVPTLDRKSFWKDSSDFSQIFNVDWFISHLTKDVKIIRELPKRRGRTWAPYTMRVPRKCNDRCYINRVLPNLLKKRAVRLTKFDYRLANKLHTDLQKLRCRVNYHALQFTDPINKMGRSLVNRMRTKSKRYIALHLRFEPDMLAFSGCYYGGGDKERKELGKIRRRWKTLHNINPDKGRRQGKCPLTPEEVGLMLRALGYDRDVNIYVASGEVYRGEESLAPLKALFPNCYSKETIASEKELEPFSGFSSRMAALDYIVCDESDVFVTNNNGNMAKMLAGRRRYFGHKPTIRPNAKKLAKVYLDRDNMTWEEFASEVRTHQRGFMGEPKEGRPGRGQFHENPSACICEDSVAKAEAVSRLGTGRNIPHTDVFESRDQNNYNEQDQEWSDQEDEDDMSDYISKNQLNGTTGIDYDAALSEEPELEELLSD